MPLHLGIDIGGSALKAVLLGPDLEIRDTNVIEAADLPAEPRANRDLRIELVERAIARAIEDGDRLTIGVATPGIVDADHRRIVSLPGKLAGLEGLDWVEALDGRDALRWADGYWREGTAGPVT